MPMALYAAQAPNPRAGATNTANGRATDARRADAGVRASRAATQRTNTVTGRVAQNVVNSDAGLVGRSAARQNRVVGDTVTARTGVMNTARVATPNVSRSATVARGATNNADTVRSATTGASRAGMARATAVFNDISKIGGGYAQCRESYATCMDQFCANANDQYRRCFCSERFTEFRDTEDALDQAKLLLAQFEDNNLNAVNKTAAEVDAMYSATVGEMAIKNDTSGASAILGEIGDLLSGKKKANTSSSLSMGIMDLDFTSDIGDVWGGGGGLFGNDSGTDLSSLEGQELYNQSNQQCLELMGDACESSAVLNMARSSYNILITQDCNLYEKNINAKREQVQQTVRTAEKYLREARLEEYRSHNSADVNECITKVKNAITADVACGTNYKKCLDHTGVYINAQTGEPIYSARLFQLENLITLDGQDADVLRQNKEFNDFLESRKMFVTTALDSCRDISATVWEEFKRSALIEISQAQDEKIEEVKMSCVSTMAECYDTQGGALKEFDDTTAKTAGALSAYAAKAMCEEKVVACAALYSNDGAGCQFDGNGYLTSDAGGCGLKALLAFVDTVDNTRVAEGCQTAIESYLKNLCTPTTGDRGYPWNCRKKAIGTTGATPSTELEATLSANVIKFALDNCADPTRPASSFTGLDAQIQTQVQLAITGIEEELEYQLMDACETLDGYWVNASASSSEKSGNKLKAFYSTVFGGEESENYGVCLENSARIKCLSNNTDDETVATYNSETGDCSFTDAWYQRKCDELGGSFDNSVCYVENDRSQTNNNLQSMVLNANKVTVTKGGGVTSGTSVLTSGPKRI